MPRSKRELRSRALIPNGWHVPYRYHLGWRETKKNLECLDTDSSYEIYGRGCSAQERMDKFAGTRHMRLRGIQLLESSVYGTDSDSDSWDSLRATGTNSVTDSGRTRPLTLPECPYRNTVGVRGSEHRLDGLYFCSITHTIMITEAFILWSRSTSSCWNQLIRGLHQRPASLAANNGP